MHFCNSVFQEYTTGRFHTWMYMLEMWTKERFQLHVTHKIILHSYLYPIENKSLDTCLLFLGGNVYFETGLGATHDSQVMFNDSSISSYCFSRQNPLLLVMLLSRQRF